jgi:hypothetical protein
MFRNPHIAPRQLTTRTEAEEMMSTEIEVEPEIKWLKADRVVEVRGIRDIADRAAEVIVTRGLKIAREVRVLIAIDASDAVGVGVGVLVVVIVVMIGGEEDTDLRSICTVPYERESLFIVLYYVFS